MKHSIISWDCTFRNFYHLIDGLLNQDYDRDEFELIYVEQRSKDYANKYNHSIGLKSLWDRYSEVKDKINFRVFYLNKPINEPYHLGNCNNHGIANAKGNIISIMDGDLLLPKDFLSNLDKAHKEQINSVINLIRFMCPYPVDASFENWKNGIIDFNKCLNICNYDGNPLPKVTANKGPLISANKTLWQKISGYDPGIIWASSASTSGMDVTARLEKAGKTASYVLQNAFCVHPWHPIGYAAKTRDVEKSIVDKMLNAQRLITEKTIKSNKYNWKDRIYIRDEITKLNKTIITEVIKQEIANDNKNYKFTLHGHSYNEKFVMIIKKYYSKIKFKLKTLLQNNRK